MTNMKSTKRALLSSVLALFLCFSMLLGTTFAWFTDSVTSANNVIQSGNLYIELEYWNNGEWKDVKDASDILTNKLWEPGVTEVAYLRVANAGSLALKYQLGINVESETEGTNAAGESFKLSDYIQFGVVEGINGETGAYATREDAVAAVTDSKIISAGYTKAEAMQSGDELYLALVVWMPTDVSNDANYKTSDDPTDPDKYRPTINLGINIFATQYTFETDSFGKDYDKGAPWTGMIDLEWYLNDPTATEFVISSAEELAGLAAIVNGTAASPITFFAASEPTPIHDDFKNKTVKLGGNINLNDLDWTPIGRIGASSTDFTYAFKGSFDGQGYTVSDLNFSNSGWSGLFGIAHSATVTNLTIDGASILSNRMAGAVVGQIYGSIENCHVENATVMAVPNAVGDSFDNGDKVGGIVGWLGDNGNNRTLIGCSATNVEIGAYRDVGGIAGYVASSTTVKGNTVAGVEITVDQRTNYYGDKAVNAGYVYGRTDGAITEDGNTYDAECAIDSTYSKNGLTLKADGEGTVALYLVPETYTGDTLNVPEGVTAIGGYAFAYNDTIEKIVLPSTVTTLNDRAFRDTSASTVVLNEGLENISYQAFRNATNVKEVVIPSTVTTISKEAFQNSGVTTLTIPANVTTIEYGGLRDMKMLETVVIKGNVDIPVYAFRACTNLKTVVIEGDDVTFGGGSRGMIFTNKENGDGSAITVYVANATVKERLVAADTAAKDYGGYKIVVGAYVAVTEADLAAALSAGKNVTLIGDINATGGIVLGEGATLDGNGHTVTYSGTEYDYQLVKLNTGAKLENITLKNYRVRTENATNGEVVLNNVVIDMDNDLTGLDISRGAGTAKLTKVVVKGTKDATHLDPNTQVQVDYTPYGDVLLGTKWGLEATNCDFGSLHGWNTTNGSNVSLNNTTYTVFRMHYWSNRTLYVNGVETAWSESGAIPVAHDVGGCWSVQPAFR